MWISKRKHIQIIADLIDDKITMVDKIRMLEHRIENQRRMIEDKQRNSKGQFSHYEGSFR